MLYERPPTFRWNKRCGFSASLDCRPESASKFIIACIFACHLQSTGCRFTERKNCRKRSGQSGWTAGSLFFNCFAYAHAMEIGGGEEERAVDVDNNVSEESDRERWHAGANEFGRLLRRATLKSAADEAEMTDPSRGHRGSARIRPQSAARMNLRYRLSILRIHIVQLQFLWHLLLTGGDDDDDEKSQLGPSIASLRSELVSIG